MHWIQNRFGTLGLGLFLFLSGMVLYFVLSGLSYFYFFVVKRQKYVPDFVPKRTEFWNSIKWAMFSLAGNAVLTTPIEVLIIKGSSRIYFDLDAYPWWWLLVSAALVLVITETLIYWIHRWLHYPWLYKKLHIYHHQFRFPTPLASVAFHPLDSFAQAIPHHLCAFLFPLNVWVYHGFVVLITIWAVLIHDRIAWVPFGFVNHTGCHTAHHWYNKHNYGQFFTFWDKLCGTYRDPTDLPERFYSSWPPQDSRRQAIFSEQ